MNIKMKSTQAIRVHGAAATTTKISKKANTKVMEKCEINTVTEQVPKYKKKSHTNRAERRANRAQPTHHTLKKKKNINTKVPKCEDLSEELLCARV